ncbi:MAG TPA: hypothetical protein HA282_01695 [Nanoarchaeota archaeon]|nr:MAG: hypothetical protein QT01_C0002G0047 [archaeon GW2011_AR6]MBS3083080.1 hypothetical protein [Candidatus Pacearchaeota archaeon]HIH18254.1 hypothetical protein [Nanoarchaeota archaeon]HIH34269.1 hypothetical protein [Nanoarchaeota archaeon]HIH50873.1 hypothetical protein [Nanoarchaeota archaeon]
MKTIDVILEKCENGKNLDPHEVAHCLIELMEDDCAEGVLKIRDAYLDDLLKNQDKSQREAPKLVNENLAYASRLADEIVRCGYDASGQLLTDHKDGGPVAEFYKRTMFSASQS